ncbi:MULTISPECIES: DUF397 domain-containing protein [Streptomyces violaceusniger group]|uniref:DUF397 domain-containing protein n=1 Tax=Streptomyces antimycoticus TaxID=68175 RepID=A0ABD5JA47_9ACTN|nr:DUF397 domain-containing protein [Streptomyces violaceusniger]MEE4585263.1 DUF397 domain-containing protein [Streptomyces sp. DSM 41602]
MNTIADTSPPLRWRKSSYSDNGGGGCVEVSDGYPFGVPVRDSKNPNGPALVFPAPSWSSFISAVKGGDFHGA